MKPTLLKQNVKLFALILCTALLLAACAQAQNSSGSTTGTAAPSANVVKTEKGQYTNISVPELQTMLKNKDFTFVNVHIPFEGNIAGTDQSIPFDTIDQHLDQLPADKNARIVLYCRSDRMSNIAARTLANLGYMNLYQLVGGFNAWKDAGLPLEMSQ